MTDPHRRARPPAGDATPSSGPRWRELLAAVALAAACAGLVYVFFFTH